MNKNEFKKKYVNYVNKKNDNKFSNPKKEQNFLYQNKNIILDNQSNINNIKKEELNMRNEYMNSYEYLKSERSDLNISYNLNIDTYNQNLNNGVKYLKPQNNEVLPNAYFENYFSSYTNNCVNENNNYVDANCDNKIKGDFRRNSHNIINRSKNIVYKKNKKYMNKLICTNENNVSFIKHNNFNNEKNYMHFQENNLNNYSMDNFSKSKNNKRNMNFMNYNTMKKLRSDSYFSNNNINVSTNDDFNKYLKENTCENKYYISNTTSVNHKINVNKSNHSMNINEDYSNENNNRNYLDDARNQNCVNNNNNNRKNKKIKKQNKSRDIFSENVEIEKKNTYKDDNINRSTNNNTPKFIYCKYCDINIVENKIDDHNKNQHVKCPIDNCNDIYNVDNLEFHLLNHMKNDKNEYILNNPKEIEKWINERKKNYPTKCKIMNDKDKKALKIKKRPSCLIEELLFEKYCSAIGRNLYYKNELKKSLFIPLLTKLSQNKFHNIYENDYYNVSNDKIKERKKNKRLPRKQLIDSLSIHRNPPLLYQLMKNEIYTYEKKLMKCIEYITENNFFDKECDIIELK